jgi:hypothetical protein
MQIYKIVLIADQIIYSMPLIFVSDLLNISSRIRIWGLLNLKQKWVQKKKKDILGNRARPAGKSNNLAAICKPIV